MKTLINTFLLLSVLFGYSQGKIDLNTFSAPIILDFRFYGISYTEHTKDVKEVHLTFTEVGRKVSYFFDENSVLIKTTDSDEDETRNYSYSNGKMDFIEVKNNRGTWKKPVIYNAKGQVFSHHNPGNIYGSEINYYEYDVFGNITKLWSVRKDNLQTSDLSQIEPIYSYKYDDKHRLIELNTSFSIENFTYTSVGDNELIVATNRISKRDPSKTSKPLKQWFNTYGLDKSDGYAMDAKGNWIAKYTNRKNEVILRNVVYFDGAISKYTPK